MKAITKIKISAALILLVVLFAHLYRGALFAVYKTAKAEFDSVATSVFYSAAESVLTDEYFNDMIVAERDERGAVTFIATDALKADVLSRKTAELTYARFSERIGEGVSVNAGVFTGVKMLSGYGKSIKIKMLSVANVTCELVSESESLGINQTSRRYYLLCRPEYFFVAPYFEESGVIEVRLLLYDYHIVGAVPDFYVAVGG